MKKCQIARAMFASKLAVFSLFLLLEYAVREL